MNPRELGLSPELLPILETYSHLRSENILYLLAWHDVIGDRKRVVSNAIGPDISSVLLLNNPDLVIGFDKYGLENPSIMDYVDLYWDFIDWKPIPRASATNDRWRDACGYEPDDDRLITFKRDLHNRKRRGYWGMKAINRWERDRLLILELKSMGVSRESIKIERGMIDDKRATKINFTWAYPGESPKPRQIAYLNATIDDIGSKDISWLVQDIDCFYQKGLPFFEYTVPYIKLIKPRLQRNCVVAIGYLMKTIEISNKDYGQNIKHELGANFRWLKVWKGIEQMINDLVSEDDVYEEVLYGMKLHMFGRR